MSHLHTGVLYEWQLAILFLMRKEQQLQSLWEKMQSIIKEVVDAASLKKIREKASLAKVTKIQPRGTRWRRWIQDALPTGMAWLPAVFYNSPSSPFSFSTFSKDFKKYSFSMFLRIDIKCFSLGLCLIMF